MMPTAAESAVFHVKRFLPGVASAVASAMPPLPSPTANGDACARIARCGAAGDPRVHEATLRSMTGALLTDLYELNMAASYLRRDMTRPATFSLFVRSLPPERGFLVAAGLASCLDFLESFAFDQDDLRYLGSIGFDDRALEDFAGLRFDGSVRAVAEGRVVHGDEPILEVTAPIPVAQLVESYLLNQITLHTTIASKAARYVVAAEGRDLVDFAFRRTHGVEAARAVARATAIVGFVATSQRGSGRALGLQVAGTMAHSFIEAFASEDEAFRAFAED